MAEPNTALYDFALAIHGDVDFGQIVEQISELQERFALSPPSVELYGRSQAGEIIVLYRFPFAAYSAALRQKMQKEAARLKGRLVEAELLSTDDRARFYAQRLRGCDVRADATGDPRAAVEAFREGMGLSPGKPAYQVQYGSPEAIAEAFARCVAEGSLFVPARRLPEPKASVSLLLSAPGASPLPATGLVLEIVRAPEPGFFALISPGEELKAFVARCSARARQGRARRRGGRRRHARIDTCLDVELGDYSELSRELAANISRGGLFVRTSRPPPLRARVRLRLKLPDGQLAETSAEVVHVISSSEAEARGCSPGAGVAFDAGGAFIEQIERLLASFQARRPCVLVVDDDRFFRMVLSEALVEAKMEVQTAGDGQQALEALAERMYELDALVLDLQMPKLDGYCLIDRIRRLGGELNLAIVVLSATSEEELADLRDRGGVSEAIRKGTPLEEIVRRIARLVDPDERPAGR